MSGMQRFVRRALLPLVIGAAALAGGSFVVAASHVAGTADVGSSQVAAAVSPNDYIWN